MAWMPPFLVFDLEASGLYNDYVKQNATHIWCICAIDQDKTISIFVKDDLIEECSYDCKPLSEFPKLVANGNYDALICHNIIHYDLRMLKKFLGIDYTIKPDTFNGKKIEIVDTLLDSKWLNPKRMLPWGCPGSIKPADGGKSKIIGPHGLEAWGYRTSKKKPSIEDWEGLHIDEYVNRCIEDIKINYDTFVLLNTEIAVYFKGVDDISQWKSNRDKAALPIYIEHKFKQDITEQEDNGVPFNIELAKSYLPILDKELDELRTHIESHLPNIPIPPSRLKDWKFPAKPFNNDGTPSKNFDKWVEKFNGRYWKGEDGKWYCEIEVDGKKKEYKAPFPDYIKTTEQMTVRSEHLAQYIIDTYGWKPMYWNYQIDPKTKKKVRDKDKKLIPTSPRFKEAQSGRLCPNLEALEVPFVKDVIRYRTLEHRRHTIESTSNDIKGYLNHPRLAIDARLPAKMDTIGAACFTADTLILSEKGQIYWEEIEVGDRVATHENRLMPVTDKFVNGYKRVFEVELENGIKTKVTDNHPFLTEGGWKECKDLSANDRVLASPSREEWKQWKDEPVMVSNWGRIRSLASGKMYKTRNLTNGRRGVDVGLRGNKFRSFRVARLVLESFNGFCPDYQCLHKNDLAYDDHIDNLYWGTQQDNAKDREKFGTSRPGSNSYKLTDRDILAILRSDKTSKETARKYSVSDSYIREIRRREKRLLKEYQEKVFSTKWIKVKSITPKGEAWTYGITVEGDHSHLTDGIFTHNTSRVTHSVVCNVPKADEEVLFGKELRSLFWNGGDPDWFFIGWDASQLENRMEGSETARYDGGAYADILLNNDIHQIRADLFGIKRSHAKNVAYALLFGAGVNKIAEMLNIPPQQAKELLDDWWVEYWATKKVIDNLQKEHKKNGGKFIRGIDGRPIHFTSPHLCMNYRIQNAGTVTMKLHNCILASNSKVIKWKKQGLVQKCIDMHDEAQWLVHKSLVRFKRVPSESDGDVWHKEKFTTKPFSKDGQWWVGYCELGVLGCNAITLAGERLGLKVRLEGEYAIGRSWGDTH